MKKDNGHTPGEEIDEQSIDCFPLSKKIAELEAENKRLKEDIEKHKKVIQLMNGILKGRFNYDTLKYLEIISKENKH